MMYNSKYSAHTFIRAVGHSDLGSKIGGPEIIVAVLRVRCVRYTVRYIMGVCGVCSEGSGISCENYMAFLVNTSGDNLK